MATKNYLLMVALVFAEILSAFELSMLYSAMRYLIEDFGSPEAVGWIITSFLLASAIAGAICGRLGDIYGRGRVLLVVIACSVAGSLIAGCSSTLAGVILGRVIQGAAGAIFPLCIGLVKEQVSAKDSGFFIGVLTAVMTVSAGFGAVLGGVLVDHFSWHWIFFVGAAEGIVAMVMVYLWVPLIRPQSSISGVNTLGGILFAPAVVLLLLVVTKGARWGFLSPAILASFILGILLAGVWVYTELKSANPLIDVRMLANRSVLIVNLTGAVLGLTAFQSLHIWSLFLQQSPFTGTGLGLSATVTGFVVLPMTLMALIGGPLAVKVIERFGGRATISGSALVLALAWAAMTCKHDSVPFLLSMLVVVGLSQAILYATLVILLTQLVPLSRVSEASGMMIVIRMTAFGIGAQIIAALLGSSTVTLPHVTGSFPSAQAYTISMLYVVIGSLAMALMASMLPRGLQQKTQLEDRQQLDK